MTRDGIGAAPATALFLWSEASIAMVCKVLPRPMSSQRTPWRLYLFNRVCSVKKGGVHMGGRSGWEMPMLTWTGNTYQVQDKKINFCRKVVKTIEYLDFRRYPWNHSDSHVKSPLKINLDEPGPSWVSTLNELIPFFLICLFGTYNTEHTFVGRPTIWPRLVDRV